MKNVKTTRPKGGELLHNAENEHFTLRVAQTAAFEFKVSHKDKGTGFYECKTFNTYAAAMRLAFEMLKDAWGME